MLEISPALEVARQRVTKAGKEGDAFRIAFGFNFPPDEKIRAFRILLASSYRISSEAVLKQELKPGDVGLK